jgi:hypothetical protein
MVSLHTVLFSLPKVRISLPQQESAEFDQIRYDRALICIDNINREWQWTIVI